MCFLIFEPKVVTTCILGRREYNVAPPDARSSQRKHKDNDCTPPLARAGSAHCCNGKRWWKGLDVRHGSNTTTNVLK
jgi:hypothetical protein